MKTCRKCRAKFDSQQLLAIQIAERVVYIMLGEDCLKCSLKLLLEEYLELCPTCGRILFPGEISELVNDGNGAGSAEDVKCLHRIPEDTETKEIEVLRFPSIH